MEVLERLTSRRETVTLPADDPEAIAYLARDQSGISGTPVVGLEGADEAATSTTPGERDSLASRPAEVKTPLISATSASSSSGATPLPPKKGPPKRKPRQSLEQMAAALDGKKMTTFEKVRRSPPGRATC